ncbi:beta-1,4-galactosyltransferase galt-1-like [Acanthaster planci]|uniref:Glycosyltransferase family 92 protein n=1 Tax=Acanthaster planci TaxID=133434 RepID=A0A8B7YNL6_ACAPL|nr:beta-1,4-galactosyltransferase galt-1-like [Acanthaster planci]
MRRSKIRKGATAVGVCVAVSLICWTLSASDQRLVAKTGARSWVKLTGRKLLMPIGLFDSMCDSSGARDLPEFGGGCYLRDKLTCNGLPVIHSAFAEAARNELVFVGVKRRDDAWETETFICEFPNGEASLTDPIVRDYRSFGNGYPQYLVVITCPIPRGLADAISRRHIIRFTVNFRLARDPRYAYTGVPVCLTEPVRRELTLCTMVKDMAKYIPDWMFYYKNLGVEHVYIYDNDPSSNMHQDLEDYVSTGFVTLVPWAHTPSPDKTYLEVQIAHENDCLWRHRHNTKWVLKVDVDEFVQPMDPNRTRITDYLSSPRLASMATIRMRNWFFGRPLNAKRKVVAARTVFERNPWRVPSATPENRGRDKCIIRPVNVHYFKIHGVKIGGDTLTLDPETEFRLVHYRKDNPRHRGFRMRNLVKDTSMVNLWDKMTGGRVVSPELFT